jgi:hypothetical protein
MTFRQFHRVSLAALLLLALLMQALLPAWAAARTQSPASWVEVCSVSGLKWVKADQAPDTVSHAAADHCALCATSGATPGFDVNPYLHTGLSDASPRAISSPLVIAFPGHALRSRAPPSFS